MGKMRQGRFLQRLRIWKSFALSAGPGSPPDAPVTLDVAVTHNLPVEFTVQPRLIESKGSSWLDSMNTAATNSP
jgi:hypothetical protein